MKRNLLQFTCDRCQRVESVILQTVGGPGLPKGDDYSFSREEPARNPGGWGTAGEKDLCTECFTDFKAFWGKKPVLEYKAECFINETEGVSIKTEEGITFKFKLPWELQTLKKPLGIGIEDEKLG